MPVAANQPTPAINHTNTGEREREVMFSLRNILIVLALSTHSLFEAMAIGNNSTLLEIDYISYDYLFLHQRLSHC